MKLSLYALALWGLVVSFPVFILMMLQTGVFEPQTQGQIRLGIYRTILAFIACYVPSLLLVVRESVLRGTNMPSFIVGMLMVAMPTFAGYTIFQWALGLFAQAEDIGRTVTAGAVGITVVLLFGADMFFLARVAAERETLGPLGVALGIGTFIFFITTVELAIRMIS